MSNDFSQPASRGRGRGRGRARPQQVIPAFSCSTAADIGGQSNVDVGHVKTVCTTASSAPVHGSGADLMAFKRLDPVQLGGRGDVLCTCCGQWEPC
ncbi:hypothetical protein HPB50_026709 [Hyalomma asiaticum]|uniref:Uncharacterized protein n=1 Tax=Hyalomma asiaticum TaxID=266040 RepID=A0ACB7RN94_HYAAI|nr:hypothetical protein HPB50_026709 [Hyalomma asiaticum]